MNSIGDLRGPQPFRPDVGGFPLALPAWIALCVGGGFAIGSVFAPDAWFQALRHPAFAPPGWLFAPVWFVLYALMGFAMWRVGEAGTEDARFARSIFLIQLGLSFLWPMFFFGLHSINGAAAISVALLGSVVATVIAFHRVDPVAARLLAPYVAWVAFATVLNAAYSYLNSAMFAFMR
jgi:translocator protein